MEERNESRVSKMVEYFHFEHLRSQIMLQFLVSLIGKKGIHINVRN